MGKNYFLNINITPENYRIHITENTKPNPQNALNFCMALRKRLSGGTIKKIYMNGLERIVYIDIECYNELNYAESKKLIIELMGKHSNIILVDENNIIIDSLRHLTQSENSARDIFPGCKYTEIEQTKLDYLSISQDDFNSVLINNSNPLSNIIPNTYIGLSRFGIQFILKVLNINDKNSNNTNDYNILYNYINNLIASNTYEIVGSGNNFYIKDISPLITKNESEIKSKSNLYLNDFIDKFYSTKELTQSVNSTKNNLLKLILSKTQKLKNKLDKINSTLIECAKMDDYKLYGELITANLYKLNQQHNEESITLENYYNNNLPITIQLDTSISPSQNAEKYYKKYKKLQNALSISEKQKELIQNELSYLDSLIYEITNTSKLDELIEINDEIKDYLNVNTQSASTTNSKEKAAHLPAEYLIDGFTVYVGKNNKQNDFLTCKMAKPYYLWFHAKDIHGSHVVLKLDKNITKLPDATIYKCACIAAYYSKAKMSQNVPVDYTFIKYVKKPNKANPGMVIYTDNKTLYVNPKNPSEY